MIVCRLRPPTRLRGQVGLHWVVQWEQWVQLSAVAAGYAGYAGDEDYVSSRCMGDRKPSTSSLVVAEARMRFGRGISALVCAGCRDCRE